MSLIQPNDVILFQGDSITDAGRGKQQQEPNTSGGLGHGYAAMAAAKLLSDRAADNLTIHNRGISGNRVVDLYARWKIDGLNLRPTVISILIGINDTWHGFMRDNGVEVPRYERFYRDLLNWTKDALPDVRLVLCEPFYTRCGVVTDDWVPDVDARRQIVRRLADEFDARFVAFQPAFDGAIERTGTPPDYWAADGVHPTPAGHQLMAETWLAAVNG